MSRHSNGQLIAIPRGDGNIHRSQDTGSSKLLCRECEGDFNKRFDSPLVNALKAWDRRINEKGFRVRYEFPPNQGAQALASIFWRASVSTNDMYMGAKVSEQDKAKLLSIVRGDSNATLKSCSCSIKRLYDKRPPTKSWASQEDISKIILPVSAYRIGWGRKKISASLRLRRLDTGLFLLFDGTTPSSREKAWQRVSQPDTKYVACTTN